MVLSPDTMLGPYRIAGVIGEGGMGAVYRAQDTRLGRDVAIKILSGLSLDAEKLARFEQEARTTGMLNHPNLLTVFDVGNHDGTPYLVTELLEGETLNGRLSRGPIPPRKAVDVALQIANGLAAAHEKGVVHRDLKPDNIFGTRDGRVKILDFGIAKLTRAGDGPAINAAATEPGMVLGTVGYMSPEQVRGEIVDQRSDIFSFGTILYEMLTGTRAFKRNSAIETLGAILNDEPPDVIDVLSNVPPALDRLVRRCLEKDRDRRFQNARDLAFNLETLSSYSSHGTLSGATLPRMESDPPPRTSTQMRQAASHDAPTAAMRPRTAGEGAGAPATSATPQPTTRTTARPRAATVSRPLPRRGVSPLLLALLFIVAVAGAAFGGWFAASKMRAEKGEPEYHRLTFRRGEVRNARFSSDGETVVYSASWEGRPSEIFVGNRAAPDAHPLGIADAEVLAVSKKAELAILLHRDRVTNLGTLALVPLAGGMPRPLADGVLQADWAPDGAKLAVIRDVDGKYRLEYPAGRTRYETPHYIREPRVSPDGKRIAFIEPHGGEYDVAVIDDAGVSAIARGWSHGVNGLAWRPDGKEIWISGTSTAAPPALYAIPLEGGEPRLVARLTGAMRICDIAANGAVLLSNGIWRAALHWKNPAEDVERDAAWFDWSVLADLSNDGRTILFNETREGGGAKNSIYLRHAGEPAAVRLGDGFADGLSPDGKWVLAHAGPKLALLPTGAGDQRELKINGSFENGAAWLPDSRRVVVGGAAPNKAYQLWLVDTLDETARPLTPENISSGAYRPFCVSPDGTRTAGLTAQNTIAIYPINGSAATSVAGSASTPVAGAEPGEIPITFSADSLALYVYRPTALPGQVSRIDLATGTRTLWKEFSPSDPAGVYKLAPIFVTPDANGYAYNAMRVLSDLYVADNLGRE